MAAATPDDKHVSLLGGAAGGAHALNASQDSADAGSPGGDGSVSSSARWQSVQRAAAETRQQIIERAGITTDGQTSTAIVGSGRVAFRVIREGDVSTYRKIVKQFFTRISTFDMREIVVLDFEMALLTEHLGVYLPELPTKYICWRRSLLSFALFWLPVTIGLQAYAIWSADELAAAEPVNTTGASNWTVTAGEAEALARAMLSGDTLRKIEVVQRAFRWLTMAQLILSFLFYLWAYMRWFDFGVSVRRARNGWLLSFALPFVWMYCPWLAYLTPEEVVTESCQWAMGHTSAVYESRYGQFPGELHAACVGAVAGLAERLRGPAADLANATVAAECGNIPTAFGQIAGLPTVTVPGLNETLNWTAWAQEWVVEPCADQLADLLLPYLDMLLTLIGVFLRMLELLPFGLMALIALQHLFPLVLGFSLGMLRGLKVTKVMTPAARLPSWLIVVVSLTSAPMLGIIFVTVVCMLGTVQASFAAWLLLGSMCIYALQPARLLHAFTHAETVAELKCRGNVTVVMQLVALILIIWSLVATPRFSGLSELLKVDVGQVVLPSTTAAVKAASSTFTTLLVFADFSLGIMNSVLVRPHMDAAEHRAELDRGIRAMSALFPRGRDADGQLIYEFPEAVAAAAGAGRSAEDAGDAEPPPSAGSSLSPAARARLGREGGGGEEMEVVAKEAGGGDAVHSAE